MTTYGLFGHLLTHSFSKQYFEEKFLQLNLRDFSYLNLDIVSVDKVKELVSRYHLDGFNITIPYKESMLSLLDSIQGPAREIGAVNCVKVNWIDPNTYTLTGHNTDHYGFSQSIKPFLDPTHEKALVLGTGGAAKAIAYGLKQIGVDVYFVSTGVKKDKNYFFYSELNEYILKACNLIVNTTPLGMHPNEEACPEIPYQYIGPQHLVYDVIYNPAETLFLKQAKEKGATTINGLNMLRLQAEKSWEIWTTS